MFQTGLEALVNEGIGRLKGRRVGLVSHLAAVDRRMVDSAMCLIKAGVRLTALFGPEHGYYGAAPMFTRVEDAVDARTGLPVFSLYADAKEPTPEMLENVDVLLFDVQDFGARYNTFLSTLVYVLRGAAKASKPVLVLDRPNPLNGVQREGGLIQPGFSSFIGSLPIPNRHGLTPAELALLANDHFDLGCDLSVEAMKGWRRKHWFEQTGRCWVPPTPGLPRVDSALIYCGTCLLEGTNLSEGRGTALPFEVAGAPWVDGFTLAEYLNALKLPGVLFRPTAFIPTASKHCGQHCCGIQIHMSNRTAFRPVTAGLHLLAACQTLFPTQFEVLSTSWEGAPAHLDLLMGSAEAREGLLTGTPVEALMSGWDEVCRVFAETAQPYLLY